jgi:hypothetical protein
VITGRTIIGSEDIWFCRDILKWPSLKDSQNTVGDMPKLIAETLGKNNLLKFRAYKGRFTKSQARNLYLDSSLCLLPAHPVGGTNFFDGIAGVSSIRCTEASSSRSTANQTREWD